MSPNVNRLALLISLLSAAAVTLVSSVGCSSGGSAGPANTTGALTGDGTLVVKMLDNSFKPNTITVAAGSKVTFELPNVGQLPHNMHIASARGVYRESPWLSEPPLSNPGTTGKLVWQVPAEPGTYKFRCDIHEVEMVGVITVQ